METMFSPPMRATHVLALISSIALFAWTRPAAPALEGRRGLLELRHNLLILGKVQLGDRQVDVRSRLGQPDTRQSLADGSKVWTYKDQQGMLTVYFFQGSVVALSGAGRDARVSGYDACSRSAITDLFGTPVKQTPDCCTYEAASRSVTFLFAGDRLSKTTLVQGD